jgi:polysaccharide biosynthesis transport protein
MGIETTEGYSTEPAAQASEGIDLTNLLGVVWRRRTPFALTAVLVLAICWAVIGSLSSRYTAQATLVLQVPNGKVVNAEAVVNGFTNDAGETAALINSEVDAIQSPELASQVVNELNLMSDPELAILAQPQKPSFLARIGLWKSSPEVDLTEEQARARVVDAVLDTLRIYHDEQSYTIKLYYEASNPDFAARIVNAFADLYLSNRLAEKSGAAGRAADWAKSKLVDLRERVTRADQAVEDFRKKHQLVDLENGPLIDQQLSRLSEELATAAAERARRESGLREVITAAEGKGAYSAPEISASPVVQQLRLQEAALLAQIAQLGSEFGPRHAQMIEAQQRLTEVRQLLKNEISRVVNDLRTAVRIAQAQERALGEQLDKLRTMRQADDVAGIDLRQLVSEAKAAHSLFDAFVDGLGRASAQIGVTEADARIIWHASPPLYPSYPPRLVLMVTSVILALLVGLVIVGVLELLDRSYRDPTDLQRSAGVPVFGLLPLLESGRGHPNPCAEIVEHPQSAFSDAVHSIAALLPQVRSESGRSAKVVMVTSSVAREGKTTLAVALARAAARSGKRVLLVDCDLWRPKVARYLRHQTDIGITELVEGLITLEQALRFDDASGMAFLPASGPARSPAEVCSSEVLRALIRGAQEDCDLIIIDTPPVGVVSDALALCGLVDEVLLAVRWGKTQRTAVLATMKKLQIRRKPATAAVFSHVDLKQYARYGYYPTNSSKTYFRPKWKSAQQPG